MTDVAKPIDSNAARGPLLNFFRNTAIDRLSQLKNGTLVLRENGQLLELGQGEPRVEVEVSNPQFWQKLVFGGHTAAGESYIDGDWHCDDLVTAMQILLSNRKTYEQMGGGLTLLAKPLRKLRQWYRRNSRKGSQKNISAHYDLGNDFYRLWLDEAMMYSSALFESPEMSLEEASIAKLTAICDKLELKKGDHVLEIGSGWGGFALFAASNYGARVTTVTISKEQYEFAKQRIAAAGLQHLIAIELKDYRDIEGQFDKLVSIEMIEAVGEAYMDTYLRQCGRLLKPNGIFVLQGIVMTERLFEGYKADEDFIQKHIFPGGFLPTVTAITQSMSKTTDLRMAKLDDIGLDYAQTLWHWRMRFMTKLDQLPAMGFDERFIRLWQFYLCYCESGFLERTISAVQVKLVKPDWR